MSAWLQKSRPQKIIQDARSQNGYFLPKETFSAKQYRFVKVNTDMLESDGEIVIPLFDGEMLIAKSSEIEINRRSGYLVWHGEQNQSAALLLRMQDGSCCPSGPFSSLVQS